MNANIAKVQSLIENAFTSAIEKLAKDESGNFISDLYVQADAESGELQIYDDEAFDRKDRYLRLGELERGGERIQ